MPSTCRAYDCSAPEIVQEAVRMQLKEPRPTKTPDSKARPSRKRGTVKAKSQKK